MFAGQIAPAIKELTMWICLKDAFFSIVQHDQQPDKLLVRARFLGDIEKVFGTNYAAKHTPLNDYPYRATIPKARVADEMHREVLDIDYGNFKAEADFIAKTDGDKRRSSAYHGMWSVMNTEGDPGRYSPANNGSMFNLAGLR